jgi:hypothetical protein
MRLIVTKKITDTILWKFLIKLWRSSGTITNKIFILKFLSVKELKESRNSLKVLDYIKAGDLEERKWLLTEVEELTIASK